MKQNESIKTILSEMRNCMLSRKKFLTVSELEGYAGLSKSYIYKLTAAKQVPHFKHPGGKLIYFDRLAIDAWLLSYEVPMFIKREERRNSYRK
jgi:excisionase family DNA binding protein